MIKSGVIGWPISHSRSPLIHGYWLRVHGIDGSYDKQAVEPSNLGTFIQALRSGERVGCNVTLPHKEAAISFVDAPDERVSRIGALNTIWRDGRTLHATSTDGPGFVQSLSQSARGFSIAGSHIVILGAGGSVRAIADELLRQNVDQISIWNRTAARAETLAAHFGTRTFAIETPALNNALRSADLLINTTSAGLKGEHALDIAWDVLNPRAVVADIVYTPLVTPFLQAAQARGHIVVPGLGMLLHQAVVGFEKWFGVKPIVTQELHDLVARDIDPEFQP